jgi:hypothetical protein
MFVRNLKEKTNTKFIRLTKFLAKAHMHLIVYFKRMHKNALLYCLHGYIKFQ